MVSVNGCHDKSFPVRGSIRNEPFMVIGTTGSCSWSANIKAPFLNSFISPVNVRRPSGKTTNEVPSFKTFSACLMVQYTLRGLDLSTKINPADSQAFPTKGILRRLFFIIHLKFLPKKP